MSKDILPNYIIGIILLFLLMGSGCQISKHIQDDQYIVRGNDIQFDTKNSIPRRARIESELSELILQEEISNLGAGWYFYWHKERKDTSAFGRYFMSRSREPAFFSEDLTKTTRNSLNNYMIQRGYFNSYTDFDYEFKDKSAYVTYTIRPDIQFKINSIEYFSKDTAIHRLINSKTSNRHLKKGVAVDQRLYELEVNRVTNLLQNEGYANFFSNFIEPLKGDSTGNKVDLVFEVLPQIDGSPHTKYTVGKVRVIPDYDPKTPLDQLIENRYDGLYFLTEDETFNISKKALNENIFLRSGSTYAREDYNKTIRRLGRLGAIKFVSIRPETDPYDSTIQNYNIFITPGPKIGLTADLDINNSTLSTFNQQFLGFTGRIGIRHRNFFGGAESNSFNISGGLELAQRSRSSDDNNYYVRLQDDLQLPRFVDFTGLFNLMSRVHFKDKYLINPGFYTKLKEDAFTRISIGSDFVIQRLFYDYVSLNATYGFELNIDGRKRWTINQIGINYFTPSFTDNFVENILNQNPFLERSLNKQFFTGFLFRELAFSYTSKPNRANESYAFLANLEVSGLEVATAGLIIGRPIEKVFNNDVELAKYVRLDLDARYNKVYNERVSAAFRINVGIAAPYESSEEIPFVKQFFVGGGLSLRAWELREIGPGSFFDPNREARGLQDRFQTGDFKFEINGEYRLKLFWALEAATFLDIGNVWMLRKDPNRPGANITLDTFLEELAIGSGLGLRLVFDYFIIRFDMGVKIKNPYPDPVTGSYLAKGNFSQMTNPNLAINYSF